MFVILYNVPCQSRQDAIKLFKLTKTALLGRTRECVYIVHDYCDDDVSNMGLRAGLPGPTKLRTCNEQNG